ncbi:MAG: hypothetical protein V7640_4125 [Betaproteobacteria bacterium]|jgi:hypothetical protein
MKTLTIKDMPKTEELDDEAMGAVHGGMMKRIGQIVPELLLNGQGEPVRLIIDGLDVSSVTYGAGPK